MNMMWLSSQRSRHVNIYVTKRGMGVSALPDPQVVKGDVSLAILVKGVSTTTLRGKSQATDN